jgi:GcrA cell cycle regulator
MPDESWPAERVEMLRTLWAEGATAVAIAARLGGVSRSAVLGKVFRLRLDATVAAENKSSAKATDSDADRMQAPVRRRRRQARLPQTPPKPTTQHKTLFELTNETCRWPHGSAGRFFFCGAPEADLLRGRPYCDRHMRRAYSFDVSFGTAEPMARPRSTAEGR